MSGGRTMQHLGSDSCADCSNTHISAQLLYPVLERNHRLSPRYLSAPATGAFAIGFASTAFKYAKLCPALSSPWPHSLECLESKTGNLHIRGYQVKENTKLEFF